MGANYPKWGLLRNYFPEWVVSKDFPSWVFVLHMKPAIHACISPACMVRQACKGSARGVGDLAPLCRHYAWRFVFGMQMTQALCRGCKLGGHNQGWRFVWSLNRHLYWRYVAVVLLNRKSMECFVPYKNGWTCVNALGVCKEFLSLLSVFKFLSSNFSFMLY